MDKDELVEFLILYFQSRNCESWHFVGYKIFKNLISHIIGVKDVNQVRSLFEAMVKLGHFEKRRTGSKCDFRFLNKPCLG